MVAALEGVNVFKIGCVWDFGFTQKGRDLSAATLTDFHNVNFCKYKFKIAQIQL